MPFIAPTVVAQAQAPMDINAIAAALLATDNPMPEASSPTPGAASKGSRYDHRHARLTETIDGTLDNNGQLSVPFVGSYSLMPAVLVQSVAAGGPVSWDISWTMVGGLYAGMVVTGTRPRPLPTQTQLSLATLLTGLITGVNTIAQSISGYDTTVRAAGVKFTGLVIRSSK